ncbi:MAG: YbaK/EbsC family protein [Rhodothermaceae bacterium]|nr:YbaK/EbsC family protein [Rhodothermaceae bacterium]MYF41058.1 YbaK/EbsC family protein [Rhodothermaceae bacterium]MYH07795.1 YbaK/EbsC family protein [Rhodothermaceae bacterium]
MKLSAKARHVQGTLRALGLDAHVVKLAESTRTATEAASAVGCTVGQIVKSLVFRAGEGPVLVLASGTNFVDEERLSSVAGTPIRRARADFVRQHTGYSIGGVAPVGHPRPIPTIVDEDLLQYNEVWAAAGGPFTVFACSPDFLATLGKVACVKRGGG